MSQKILRIIHLIKNNLKQIEDEGVYHPLHDEIYDQLSLIEDELYSDDEHSDFNFEDEDY
jgi:hypothetical protein